MQKIRTGANCETLFVNRPEALACSEIRTLQIFCAKGCPSGWSKNLIAVHIVHIYRNAQHGAEGKQVGPNVSIAECAVICTPVCHDTVNILKRTLSCQPRRNPRSRPRRVRALVESFVNAVFVYDDKVVFTFNYKDGSKTATIDEITAELGSDLDGTTPP